MRQPIKEAENKTKEEKKKFRIHRINQLPNANAHRGPLDASQGGYEPRAVVRGVAPPWLPSLVTMASLHCGAADMIHEPKGPDVVPVARVQMKSPFLGWANVGFCEAQVTVAKVPFHTAALEIAPAVAKSQSPRRRGHRQQHTAKTPHVP